MPTRQQISANRRNAKASTGPLTSEGKARASQNALRHGLATAAPNPSPEVLELAQKILAGGDPERLPYAVAAAECAILLRRVYRAKTTLIDMLEADEAARHLLVPKQQGPADADSMVVDAQRRSAAIVKGLSDLVNMDRYAERASSRQRRAIRALYEP